MSATTNSPFSGQTATVTDANQFATASQLSATINWGDGTPASAGTVSGANGSFTVSGTHTYVSTGSFTVTTAVTDSSGDTATATIPTVTHQSPAVTAARRRCCRVVLPPSRHGRSGGSGDDGALRVRAGSEVLRYG